MKEGALIPDYRGFSNHDSGSMVDEKIQTNLCTRMDFHSGPETGQYGQKPRNQGDAGPEKAMANPIQ